LLTKLISAQRADVARVARDDRKSLLDSLLEESGFLRDIFWFQNRSIDDDYAERKRTNK
jgi:predicted thioredoxin/glutaredoxin